MPHTLLKTQIQSVLTHFKVSLEESDPGGSISAILITCVPKTGEKEAGDLTLLVHTRTHEYTCIVCRIYICMCMLAIAKEIYSGIYSNTFVGWLVV